MDQSIELTLEQKFNLRSFQTQIDDISHDQAKQLLVQLYEQMLVKDAMYRHFLKHQWGLEPKAS
jgi:hypothetical protein